MFFYFSIDLLAKTLFLPWKRDEINTANLSLEDKIRVMMMNVISRLVGATVRGGTIIFGLVFLGLIILSTAIALILFYLTPILVFYLLFLAF